MQINGIFVIQKSTFEKALSPHSHTCCQKNSLKLSTNLIIVHGTERDHNMRDVIYGRSQSRSAMETIRNAVMDIGEPRQLVLPCPYCGDNKVRTNQPLLHEDGSKKLDHFAIEKVFSI